MIFALATLPDTIPYSKIQEFQAPWWTHMAGHLTRPLSASSRCIDNFAPASPARLGCRLLGRIAVASKAPIIAPLGHCLFQVQETWPVTPTVPKIGHQKTHRPRAPNKRCEGCAPPSRRQPHARHAAADPQWHHFETPTQRRRGHSLPRNASAGAFSCRLGTNDPRSSSIHVAHEATTPNCHLQMVSSPGNVASFATEHAIRATGWQLRRPAQER